MILKVDNLNASLKKGNKTIIDDLSFEIGENECLGILGESGSGKSMSWKSFMGMVDSSFSINGEVKFKDSDLLNLNPREKRQIRGKDISIIVQNPMTAFDPLFTIGNQIIETFLVHSEMSKKEAYELALEILSRMRIENPLSVMSKHPHELSGGMIQRIMIGIALALNPSLIIADEPTTAIDSINQMEVLKEFEELKANHNLSMMFISHDLSVLARMADRIMVMSKGRVIETGPVDQIMHYPQHEETRFIVENRVKLLERFQKLTKETIPCS